jgi:hypothetical protein
MGAVQEMHDDAPPSRARAGDADLTAEIRGLRADLAKDHKENRGDLSELRESVAELRRAFPGDDPEGHRRFHDALIAESMARKKFWSDLSGRLIERGIWAVLAMLAAAVWVYFKESK